jgi:hypothetical protein
MLSKIAPLYKYYSKFDTIDRREKMFNFITEKINGVVDTIVDIIIPLDNFGPLTDDDEINW